VKGFIDW
jgi:Transposase IS4